jgi:hypothetical protein
VPSNSLRLPVKKLPASSVLGQGKQSGHRARIPELTPEGRPRTPGKKSEPISRNGPTGRRGGDGPPSGFRPPSRPHHPTYHAVQAPWPGWPPGRKGSSFYHLPPKETTRAGRARETGDSPEFFLAETRLEYQGTAICTGGAPEIPKPKPQIPKDYPRKTARGPCEASCNLQSRCGDYIAARDMQDAKTGQ